MKEEGRNDTTHNDEIPKESRDKVEKLLAQALEVMLCDKASPKYRRLVAELPLEYQNEHHRLYQFGAMYILGMSFARRGREGKPFEFRISSSKLKSKQKCMHKNCILMASRVQKI